MTTEQYLRQISKLDNLIKNKVEQIRQLRDLATSITVATDKENVKSSGDKDRLGSAVAKIVDLEREIDELVSDYTSERVDIVYKIDTIADINTKQYVVLTRRYVNDEMFEVIASDMKLTWRQVMNIHKAAKKTFERVYGSEYSQL